MKFELVEIITKDNLVHQGIYCTPKHKGAVALLWVHGLTGRFYGDVNLMNLFAQACDKHGIAFASFNNRGHDVIANMRKVDSGETSGFARVMIGAAMEVFEDCIFDIDAGISFLQSQGCTKIIVAGHSTGANKVCYYAAEKNDPRVAGVVLAGPMSDRFSRNTDKANYERNVRKAKLLLAGGKGDQIMEGKHFFPITPRRMVSLLAPNTHEDVFNYGDTKRVLSEFAKIAKPLLVVFSGNDETADRPIESIKHVFDVHAKSKKYTSVIIPDTTHSYEGKEKEFVSTVIDWTVDL